MKRGTAGTTITRAKLGEQRCFWSMRIYEHLKRQGVSVVQVAWELGITRQSVCATIRGANHSAKVLDYLRSTGVSEKYLFDPRGATQAGGGDETVNNRKVA